MNMEFFRKLPTPKEIKEMYPLTMEMEECKKENDRQVKNIITGEDNRLLLIIGPCSADREDAVMDYLKKLKKLSLKVNDKILIVPRLYTNKPRTTGDGYKGMLHQPDPTGKPDMLKGLIASRRLHMRALSELGFSCADEMLYTENHRYLSDLLSYTAVGARSVESQQHRLTASGLDIPVGMKNPTSGDFHVLLNSVNAAQHPHTFIYRGWEVRSQGNPLAHIILRGYVNKKGEAIPNYHYEDLLLISRMYDEANLLNPAIIVDCNHSNSGKNYLEQIRIAKEVVSFRSYNEKIKKMVKGLMIESYLLDGCQKPDGSEYGKSITDPCLGFDKTEELIMDLYKML